MILSVRSVSSILKQWEAQVNDILSEEDLKKSGRFRQQSDRDRFIAARILCYEKLKSEFEIQLPLIFEYSELGKPKLRGAPEFNWSHSGEFAAFICGPGAGIDIELFSDIDPQSFHSVFTPDQMRWIGSSRNNFFKLWTIKEAVMKSTGLGFRLNPLQLRPIFTDDENETWQLHFEQTVFHGRTKILKENTDQNYAISYCATKIITEPDTGFLL